MEHPDRASVVDYYFDHFLPGMVDLSSSSPSAHTGVGARPGVEEYPAPGGLLPLRGAIAALYPGLTEANIVVTNGASEALAACALAFVGAGERVSLAQGAYPSFREMASRLGALGVSGATPEPASVMLVNNPTVPDGRLLDITDIVSKAAANGTRIIADEVYLHLRAGAPALPAVCASSNAVSIGDVSKPLGLGGLRIGWAASRDPEAIRAISRAVQVLSGGPSVVAMEMANTALVEYDARFTARINAAAANAPAVFSALEAADWRHQPPQAGWTFLAVPPAPLDAGEIERLREAGLFLVPASAFGAGEGYRLSVFAEARSLRRALRLVARPADSVAPETLVVLAKAPAPGLSKTRLAAQIGELVAASFAQAFLNDTLSLGQAVRRPLLVTYTPEDARGAFARIAPGAQLLAQPEGDLGTRILVALNDALGRSTSAVLIGSDTPHLPAAIVEQAFVDLQTCDMTIGPASDGGFYLIGFNAAHVSGEVFAGVEWSTGAVFATVMANAERLGMTVEVLPEVTDIDDLASLEVAMDAARASGNAHQTRTAVRALGLEMARVS